MCPMKLTISSFSILWELNSKWFGIREFKIEEEKSGLAGLRVVEGSNSNYTTLTLIMIDRYVD